MGDEGSAGCGLIIAVLIVLVFASLLITAVQLKDWDMLWRILAIMAVIAAVIGGVVVINKTS